MSLKQLSKAEGEFGLPEKWVTSVVHLNSKKIFFILPVP
jgi:hypothetical protein